MDSATPFVTLLIVILIFLICRELVCWYWKLNEVVSLLRDIKESLNKIESELHKPPGREEPQ